MFLRKPFQEGHGLVPVGVLEMRTALQPLDLLLHAAAHRFEVGNRHCIVGQGPAYSGLDPFRFFMRQNGKMNLNDRNLAAILHGHDRVEQRRHLESLSATFPQHRIHQKRHVGTDRFDNRPREHPAILALGIQKDADVLRARRGILRPVPVPPGQKL